jgi:hypothetical protein
VSKPSPSPPIFFIDRDLGQRLVAQALREAGAQVEIHQAHFAPDSPDIEWLPEVSQRGWVVLTKDACIDEGCLYWHQPARASRSGPIEGAGFCAVLGRRGYRCGNGDDVSSSFDGHGKVDEQPARTFHRQGLCLRQGPHVEGPSEISQGLARCLGRVMSLSKLGAVLCRCHFCKTANIYSSRSLRQPCPYPPWIPLIPAIPWQIKFCAETFTDLC